MAAMLALLLTVALAAPGDRHFARGPTLLFRGPSESAPPVRGLLEGDELIELDPPEDELVPRKPPAGWVVVQTVDVPSERSFRGWVQLRALGSEPLGPTRRTAVLHRALDQALDELAQRSKPFADLRGQVLAWREKAKADPSAADEMQKLANQLAHYMETEVTPRALDIQDALAELKELDDPKAPPLAARFAKLALGFQP
jgi:hypothetical protein